MAKMREVQKEKSLERSAEERADVLNRIQLRYYNYPLQVHAIH